MKRMLTGGVCALGLVVLAGADWPRFRGPNGSGVVADKAVPSQWTAFKWQCELPGEGNGSPIVSKGKIFLQASSKDQTQRMLVCVDAATGKIAWQKEFRGGAAKTHKLNSPASSTPAADGERVYALFWDGDHIHITAWSYTGELLWKRDLGGFKSQHGAGLSPIVVGNRVILNNDQDGSAQVLAFDTKTGDPAWQVSRPAFRACYSTPFTMGTPDGPVQLIVGSTAGVASYDPQTGKEYWRWDWKFAGKSALRTVGSPIAHNGMIFAYSGDGGGDRDMAGIQAGNTAGAAPKKLWGKTKGTPYVPCILADGNFVYWVLDKEGTVVCVDAKSGTEVWSKRLGGGGVTASPVLVDGKIYIITERGTVYVLRTGGSYELIAKNSVPEGVYASPAVADGKLFIRGGKHLFCIGS